MAGSYWIIIAVLIFFSLIYLHKRKTGKDPGITGPDGRLYHRKEEYIDYYSGRNIWLLTRFGVSGQSRDQTLSVFFKDTGERCLFTVYKIRSGGYIQYKDGQLSMVKTPPDIDSVTISQ
jgi:hypothetical protein